MISSKKSPEMMVFSSSPCTSTGVYIRDEGMKWTNVQQTAGDPGECDRAICMFAGWMPDPVIVPAEEKR